MTNTNQTHVVALLSGGLDSMLAAKLMEKQGVKVTCLHFCTPFFGKPHKIDHWRETLGLTIIPVDVGDEYAEMLSQRPVHGFGKIINPCVDCKILMLRHAARIMKELGACAIITGEVLGQRPMSQRRDALNIIQRDAGVKGLLLRPLTAKHLEPCQAELDGKIDRSQLLGLSGRGRKAQLALAKELGITEIPTPAGGCRLAEKENARNYWNILQFVPNPKANDFYVANIGRQLWSKSGNRLVIGRNQADNDAIMARALPTDILIKVRDFTGPIALLRFQEQEFEDFTAFWKDKENNSAPALFTSALSLVASYSTKGVAEFTAKGESLAVRYHKENLDTEGDILRVVPERESTDWQEGSWEETKEAIKAERKIAEE